MKLRLNRIRNKICNNNYYSISTIFLLFSIFLSIQISGCITPRRIALPDQYADSAEIPGMPGVRDWGDIQSEVFQKDFINSLRQDIHSQADDNKNKDDTINILAISGGGPDGAFAAGFLNGWEASGTRPTFKLVTGISAGSLVAPFVFLGGKYDEQIREITNSISTTNIFTIISPLSIIRGTDSIGDSTPLANLIATYVDEDMLKHIATAHAEGRRLYLGTTNLDAQRLVLWNMGAIASSGRPDALELFRKIMRASASIPVLFQPMLFQVEADGITYDEMHVDGGTAVEISFYGDVINTEEAYKSVGITKNPKETLFIIGTSQVQPHYRPVERSLISIGAKAITSLLQAQGIGDTYRIYAAATQEGIDFNLASIPPEWEPNPQEPFDPDDMQRLYALGYKLGKSGYTWQKQPPYYLRIEEN